jgi:hypothetical protein
VVLVGKQEGKRPVGRSSRRWEDKIKMNFSKWNGRHGLYLSDSVKDRWLALANAVMNIPVPINVENFLTSREPVSCSRRTLLHGVSK